MEQTEETTQATIPEEIANISDQQETEAENKTAETTNPHEEKQKPSPYTEEKSSSPTTEELAKMLAEAERQGYLRGRNEAITTAMEAPALWENTRRREMEQECDTGLSDGFLRYLRPGVWD